MLRAFRKDNTPRVRRIITRFHMCDQKFAMMKLLYYYGKFGKLEQIMTSDFAVKLLRGMNAEHKLAVLCNTDCENRTILHWIKNYVARQ